MVFSVPSGAFGNLFAGYLARAMGLPVTGFVCANNVNNALSTALTTGVFEKRPLRRTVSSAIDIVVPYNFWRFLYFLGGVILTNHCLDGPIPGRRTGPGG